MSSLPSRLRTLNVRIVCALSSVGLSIRYWRFGAVNVHGSSVGKSCVAGIHDEPFGGSNVMRTLRAVEARAPTSASPACSCARASDRCRGRCRRRDRRKSCRRCGRCRRARRRPTDTDSAASAVSSLPLPSNAWSSKTFFANSCTRVAARRRAAHARLERAAGHVRRTSPRSARSDVPARETTTR